MDELMEDLAATRAGMENVRGELEKRPTRKQFNFVIAVAVLVVIVVCIAAVAAVRSANDSGDAKEAAQAVNTGFFILSCRTDINAKTVGVAQQAYDAAVQDRASAIQERDNLTIQALQALAVGNDEGVKEVAFQAPSARDLVTWTDAIVNNRLDDLESARDEYQKAIDGSIKDPEGFIEECMAGGD